MAPTKRARPAFDPPRPRKSTAKSKSSNTTSRPKSIPKSKKPSTSTSKPKAKPKAANTEPRRRSRLVSPTPSEPDSLGEDSDQNEDESMSIDNDNESPSQASNNDEPSSPEPDFILAEVSHSTEPTTPPIPLDLIHHILHAHYPNPDTTTMSRAAKELVGKYIEVFVREAVMRCAYEKNGETQGHGSGDVSSGGGGEGWLELEDLERVAVQLCLDF